MWKSLTLFIRRFFISLLVGQLFALELTHPESRHIRSLNQVLTPSPLLEPTHSPSFLDDESRELGEKDGTRNSVNADGSHEESTSATKENCSKSQSESCQVHPNSQRVSVEVCLICRQNVWADAEHWKCSTCRPKYHKKCIARWLDMMNTCPTCRKTVVRPRPTTSPGPTSANSIDHHEAPRVQIGVATYIANLAQHRALQLPVWELIFGKHPYNLVLLFNMHPGLLEKLFDLPPGHLEWLFDTYPSHLERLLEMYPMLLQRLFHMSPRHLKPFFDTRAIYLLCLFETHPTLLERLFDIDPDDLEWLCSMHPRLLEELKSLRIKHLEEQTSGNNNRC